MDKTDAKGIIYLIGSLWTNYLMPQNPDDEESLVTAWCNFFRDVKRVEVEETIYAISAEGANFAPQIGQVYAKLRERRKERRALQRLQYDQDFYHNCLAYAAVTGQSPPPESAANSELERWFNDVRERARRVRKEEGTHEDHTKTGG